LVGWWWLDMLSLSLMYIFIIYTCAYTHLYIHLYIYIYICFVSLFLFFLFILFFFLFLVFFFCSLTVMIVELTYGSMGLRVGVAHVHLHKYIEIYMWRKKNTCICRKVGGNWNMMSRVLQVIFGYMYVCILGGGGSGVRHSFCKESCLRKYRCCTTKSPFFACLQVTSQSTLACHLYTSKNWFIVVLQVVFIHSCMHARMKMKRNERNNTYSISQIFSTFVNSFPPFKSQLNSLRTRKCVQPCDSRPANPLA
jgi:hypothetical protein